VTNFASRDTPRAWRSTAGSLIHFGSGVIHCLTHSKIASCGEITAKDSEIVLSLQPIENIHNRSNIILRLQDPHYIILRKHYFSGVHRHAMERPIPLKEKITSDTGLPSASNA
jgi:hypothetical protein